MHSLKTSSVNNEIWRQLDRNVKNQDLKLSSKTQILICKAITSQLQFIDLLLKKTKQERTTLPEGTHKTGHGLFNSDDLCVLRHFISQKRNNRSIGKEEL
jgi:hypothetical protein